MKISICIPQYNRINFLLKSLKRIESQTYSNIEVVVSDDFSTDDTESEIKRLQGVYKYPLIYSKNEINLGYDRNYRKSIELSSGDYCVLIGNDDSIYEPDSISYLVKFLDENDLPDIGYCNFIEDNEKLEINERANFSGVLGSGTIVAMQNYSCFSFVGGLIYKRSAFLQFNTDKFDGSVYTQMYIGTLMILKGCKLFSISKPLILKDIHVEGKIRNSYRDFIAKRWKDFKIDDGGLKAVINVLINAFRDASLLTDKTVYTIFKRIYLVTYPHWLLDYRQNGAFPASAGLVAGLKPLRNNNFKLLPFHLRIKVFFIYLYSTFIGLFTPIFIFKALKSRFYKFYKKHFN